MKHEPHKETVRAGYDALGDRYAAWTSGIGDDAKDLFLAQFVAALPSGARVLDLGCGPGGPATRRLADTFDVLGVDLSEKQLELARLSVPTARFMCADFSTLEFPERSFDGVTALHSITHVPREEHEDLFLKIARWLKPGGRFLASLSVDATQGWTGEWLGVPMFFSGWSADSNRRLLREAGFALLVDEVAVTHEPEGPVRFLWIIGARPG